ncbi:MAG: folate-binding protein YgfZ [Rhizobiaceae bacterium]|nr:folate-binding protein YgfZ [Rhizobiaceae bacterium]
MPTVHLTDRALIEVAGSEAEHFLQNILTTDLDQLPRGEARPGALLSPQGKILFDFLISRHGEDGFRLDVDRALADDFSRRLALYKLRAKAQISKQDQLLVVTSWHGDSTSSQIDSSASHSDSTLVDRRFPTEAGVRRRYLDAVPGADATVADWTALRIRHAVAESGSDFAAGDAFPHDVLLDQNGGVGFRKGCYVGQEVVSRMQHRGTARRRVLIARGDAALPAAGTEVRAGERSIGAMGSVAGNEGVAIVRIDRVKDAMDAGQPITAGGVALSLSIPVWAHFGFPEGAAAAGE